MSFLILLLSRWEIEKFKTGCITLLPFMPCECLHSVSHLTVLWVGLHCVIVSFPCHAYLSNKQT